MNTLGGTWGQTSICSALELSQSHIGVGGQWHSHEWHSHGNCSQVLLTNSGMSEAYLCGQGLAKGSKCARLFSHGFCSCRAARMAIGACWAVYCNVKLLSCWAISVSFWPVAIDQAWIIVSIPHRKYVRFDIFFYHCSEALKYKFYIIWADTFALSMKCSIFVMLPLSKRISVVARACSTYHEHKYMTTAWIHTTCKKSSECLDMPLCLSGFRLRMVCQCLISQWEHCHYLNNCNKSSGSSTDLLGGTR